ncbi:MAG: head decoration protein [Pseudomonadota bacterium]
MATKTETAHRGEFIVSEANGTRSRETVTVLSGTPALTPGEVLGLVTASDKYTVYDNGASDGSEAAAAVLVDPVDASTGDVSGVVVITADAELRKSGLTFQSGQDAAAQTAAFADLKSLGIKAR